MELEIAYRVLLTSKELDVILNSLRQVAEAARPGDQVVRELHDALLIEREKRTSALASSVRVKEATR